MTGAGPDKYARRAGVEDFAMCLTGGALTVALVTAHVPLKDVAAQLSTSEIVRVGNLSKPRRADGKSRPDSRGRI